MKHAACSPAFRTTCLEQNLTLCAPFCRYDAEVWDFKPETYEKAKASASPSPEPMADVCYDETSPSGRQPHTILQVELLPGQPDQRADSVHSASSVYRRRNAQTVAATKSAPKASSLLRTWSQDPRLSGLTRRHPRGFMAKPATSR